VIRQETLRTGLDAITNDHVPLRNHAALIAALAKRHPHSIVVEETRHSAGFNCFAYALGLHIWPTYRNIAETEANNGGSRFFASSRFATWLVTGARLVPVALKTAVAGDLALYGIGPTLLHAACFRGAGRLESKWGNGHLYEHGLWEVPARYGNYARFYRAPSLAVAKRAFAAWISTHEDWPGFVRSRSLPADLIAPDADAWLA
jgi:hypothetical protein